MILQTKFHIPPQREKRVKRQRLMTRLNRIPDCKLTVIRAPAGFGKTTLIRDWIETTSDPVGWLSLDPSDNAPYRFAQYFVHAFHALDQKRVPNTLALLNSSHQPALETLFSQLVNDLSIIESLLILVLDDFHVIDSVEIHLLLDFFLTHMPAQVHLVITSRQELPLHVSRLRAQAQLLEIDSADLRFTAIEVEAFLRDVMSLDLTSADRTTLEMRTEGWIAGLQLAGLSLQTSADVHAFIQSFAGTNRLIEDYLFEEVLRHQPPHFQHFLMQTSVVDEMSAGLCDALMQNADSHTMLVTLENRQLFIVPIDHQRVWYRYHHLFRDLLRRNLQTRYPDQLQGLYQRAGRWYAVNDRIELAIEYGILADAFEQVADDLETVFDAHDWVRQDMNRILDWFHALPDAILQSRLSLYLSFVWLKFEMLADAWGEILADLSAIESALATPQSHQKYTPDELLKMQAQVDMLRANYARFRGDSAGVITLCQHILDRLPADELYIRSGAIAHMASAYENLGDFDQASDMYQKGIVLCRNGGNIDGLLFASANLIELYLKMGTLRQAQSVFDALEDLQASRTGPDMGANFIAIAEVYRQQGQLEQARTFLKQGIAMCRPFEAWQASTSLGLERLAKLDQIELRGETLTERELETLQLLATDHSTEEIADRLAVSLSTIRTYCKRIYSKLDVHSRAEAVYRARELNLI